MYTPDDSRGEILTLQNQGRRFGFVEEHFRSDLDYLQDLMIMGFAQNHQLQGKLLQYSIVSKSKYKCKVHQAIKNTVLIYNIHRFVLK